MFHLRCLNKRQGGAIVRGHQRNSKRQGGFVVPLQHVSSRTMRVLIFLISPLEFEKL
jgi:hypothetical protein